MKTSDKTPQKYSATVLKTLVSCLVIISLVSGCTQEQKDTVKDKVKGTVKEVITEVNTQQNDDGKICNADAAWFPQSQTPATDDLAFTSTSNCNFHQWAWQKFLWLTQSVDGEPRFMTFAAPESLLGPARKGMMPRTAKGADAHAFNEYLQAGTDGIFVAHNGRAVYYSQYLNKTFVDFVVTNGLTDYTKVQSLVAENPNKNYPIDKETQQGSTELKVSWMIVEAGDDVSDMFTTTAEIATLANSNGKIIVDSETTQKVTLALVGFHIAGVVQGHPEMIWATFEHNANAPNVPPGTPLEAEVADQDFTFYTANTTAADCNINYSSSNKLVLNQDTQLLSPITQVCRQYEYGNEQGVDTINDDNIKLINQSVAGQIGADNVWQNYREVGAIWFKQENSLEPGLSLGDDKRLIGSLSLSNSTIETFTQIASTEDNCFRCHNTMQQFPPEIGLEPLAAANLNISHAFLNIYFGSQRKAANTTPTAQGEE